MTEIKEGQIWKDRDRRREADGSVRRFRVLADASQPKDGARVAVREVNGQGTGKLHYFRRGRFGRNAQNDSLMLAE